MEVAKLTDVTRVYKIGEVETRALNGVSLAIQSGEFTSLVGPSGSGKTTLLQLIGVLDQPTSGKVVIDGKETTRPKPQSTRGSAQRDDWFCVPILCPYPNSHRI
jgi:putative ABC transport system ATP-binding protein